MYCHKKRLNYAISYNFEISKGMSHNLELSSFQKMHGLKVYKKNESARAICLQMGLKGG